jgi:hypothetical protein
MRAYGELTRLHGTRTADRRITATLRMRWRLSSSRQSTLSELQLEKPLASRLFLIIAKTALLAWKREASPIRPSISINIQRLARAVRCPNHPGAESIARGSPIGYTGQLHLVIIGAVGCPCSLQVLAALQQPCVAQSVGSLHRLSGLIIALLRPVTCFLEFGLPSQLSPAVVTLEFTWKEGIWHAITIMSSGAQDDSPQPAADRAARRTSFGRALERFRTVFTRRGSNKATPVVEQDTPTTQPQVPALAVKDAGVAPASPAAPIATTHGTALEVDEDENAIDDFDDTEEPIIPVDATTSRPGISEDKARLLFEKYGLRYPAAKRPQQDPPNKIRRVEKPVRIRLHWSCHQCKTPFAHAKVCTSCGHGRCGDCTPSPPQRVLRILEKTKREKETAEILAKAAAASPHDNTLSSLSPTMVAEQIPEIDNETPSAPLPKVETEPLRFVYTIRSSSLRGTGGLELYHMTRNSCNRDTPNPSIQRVFKQPRQRVRWTCDHCDSIFTHRDRCSNCQHEKCVDCIRSP